LDVLAFGDLDLHLMSFIYELDAFCLEIHGLCEYELHMLRLSKFIV